MLIAEHFFLITLNPESGSPEWPRRTQPAPQLAAAALLLELATLHCLQLQGDLLVADAAFPLRHPLLDGALRELATHPATTASGLARIERRLHPLPRKILDGLYQRDVVHHAENRWMPWRGARYPLRSVQARNEAISRLRHAIAAADDMAGLALLLLMDISGLLPAHLNAREHATAAQRLLALNSVAAQTEPVHGLFAAVRAALLA
jgi:hypothetical protein